jgi:hypothetical protein
MGIPTDGMLPLVEPLEDNDVRDVAEVQSHSLGARADPIAGRIEGIRSFDKQNLARPTGVGRGITTYEIPIEGRDEWLAAARRLA